MSKVRIGRILFVLGIILLLLSLFADYLGIGGTAAIGFGYKQVFGTLAGIVLVILGWLWWRGFRLS